MSPLIGRAGALLTMLLALTLVFSSFLAGASDGTEAGMPELDTSTRTDSAVYSSGMDYSLTAEGKAIHVSNGSAVTAGLSMNLTVSETHGGIVSMDSTFGTLEIGDERLSIHSGKAYYLIPFHQIRIFGHLSIESSQESNGIVKIAALTEGREDLPAIGQVQGISINILGPPSRIESDWFLQLDGQIIIATSMKKEEVTLTAILNDNGDPERFHLLLDNALGKLRERHPTLDINIIEQQFPYPEARTQLIASVTDQTSADLVSIDQIWLGELAEGGMLTDLTSYAEGWGRSSDWYLSNWDGGAYKGKTYAVWIWTDVRGMYYWKDMLEESGVEPSALETWEGYLSSAKILNEKLRPRGIEGVHLTGVGHSPDLWYPYLWMLGGDIVEQRSGHPEKGVYWFPAYNSSQGVEALTFIKDQIDLGIVPQAEHYWGKEFHDRKFAVMIEASHVPGYFELDPKEVTDKVGFIPMFPVPNATVQTTTLMGGWELAVPSTSKHKDLSWELITLMANPEILSPWLAKYNYLPTQLPIGEGPYSESLAATNPFFSEMASEIQYGRSRPSIPEYPLIAEHIREAINDVYYGNKDPKQALDNAAEKSVQVLGWIGVS